MVTFKKEIKDKNKYHTTVINKDNIYPIKRF